MAVELDVERTHVEVQFTGWDRVWALRRGARVPIDHVTAVHVDDRAVAVSTLRRRIAGSWIPRRLAAGLFATKGGGRQLWCVHRAPRVLVVDLEHERWQRLVLEVPDPTGAAAWIEAAMSCA
jgi:hypothetical protein